MLAMRAEPFDKLSTAPFDKLSTAPFDKLRAHMQEMDKPASLAMRTLRRTQARVMSRTAACRPGGQLRRSRVRVLAVD
jgi:hypothetical protein